MFNPSRYNFQFEYNEFNKKILFNSLSNSCLLIDNEEDWQDIKNVLAHPDSNMKSHWYNTLIDQRFLIPQEQNEIGLVRQRFDLGKKQKKSLTITIACTIQCNFRCTYCFEPHRNQYLSEENFKKLRDLIEKEAPQYDLVQITWFGGEPLLMAEKIAEWSEQLIEICDRVGTQYLATIVTNGSLLIPKNIDLLKKSQIKGIQVTIDGPERIHDRTRPSVGGKGTYQKIVTNLQLNKNKLSDFQLTIRVNVDKENLNHAEELLQDLSDRRLNEISSIYFARVENSTEYCGDISNKCFSAKDFSQELNWLNRRKVEFGFSGEEPPRPVFSFCGALTESSFVIDAVGDLFKCWHDVGNPKKRYSTISEHKDRIFKLAEYQGYSHFTDQDCLDCKVLPLCQGNCPYYRIQDKPQKQCSPLKFNLRDHLKNVYRKELEA